jgi:hypothetical protein
VMIRRTLIVAFGTLNPHLAARGVHIHLTIDHVLAHSK